MIDVVITATILGAIRDRPDHNVAEMVLFVTYVVVVIAAIVTAATLRSLRRGETSSITLAAVSPCTYFLLLPFGVLSG